MAAIYQIHLAKAESNGRFLGTIDKNEFPDWYVTTVFYRALHLVSAFIYKKKRISFREHRERNDFIATNFPEIFKLYSRLYQLSLSARYFDMPKSKYAFEAVAKSNQWFELLIDLL
ncbi:MAG: hypothetical protein NUW37_17590 [Planctomycetes bacterium]|nr:hypothetical protein [Planctomycetota bacterium]